MKFLLANVADFDTATQTVPYENLLEIDRYALGVLHDLSVECCAAYDAYELHRVAQALQSFCAEDLGAFYLDILKDRLYTNAENSHDRRAAQTVLLKITQVLAGLMAPILSYTAEEIWQTLNPNADDFVVLHNWLDANDVIAHKEYAEYVVSLKRKWEVIRKLRAMVMKEIEENLRSKGKVGSSLQAEIMINVDESTYRLIADLAEDLRFIMITSTASLQAVTNDSSLYGFSAQASSNRKCDRCWHYRADVGANKAHAQICGRCVSNLFGKGEPRKYA